MIDAQNTKILQTYVDALSKGEMDTVGKLLADDVIWHQPGASHLSGLHSGKQKIFAHLCCLWGIKFRTIASRM